jgi:hypothetical protein
VGRGEEVEGGQGDEEEDAQAEVEAAEQVPRRRSARPRWRHCRRHRLAPPRRGEGRRRGAGRSGGGRRGHDDGALVRGGRQRVARARRDVDAQR